MENHHDGEGADLVQGLDLVLVKATANSLLTRIRRIEKKAFPATEAFDFSTELHKRNTQLFCALYAPNNKPRNRDTTTAGPYSGGDTATLVGYLVVARTGRTALLHKICVVPQYQRRGVGKWMVRETVEGLRKNGCGSVVLWVGEGRAAARCLYAGCGFEEVQRVEGYYAPGRTGVKMVLDL
ncbi:MAG: hypothetical protein M1839_007882 [Geoglossum umbratile]|nr:MAG: hypothetical protein M1839_007882 [Geoglossum umbratile]